jgi:hypothetical protein
VQKHNNMSCGCAMKKAHPKVGMAPCSAGAYEREPPDLPPDEPPDEPWLPPEREEPLSESDCLLLPDEPREDSLC